MEHASTMPELPSFKNLRSGQSAVAELFKTKMSVVAKLPTGYGKTLTAAASYVMLRSTHKVNRLLYIVPRAAQASQAAHDLPLEVFKLSGEKASARVIGSNTVAALKDHRSNAADIFVATVQSLVQSRATIETVRNLMESGRWFLVIDEHHHYGNSEDNVWTKRVMDLRFEASLAMSATPDRFDGPSIFGTPDVSVGYREAQKEKYVKRLELHVYDYRVDAINVNGDVIPYDTRELLAAVGSDDPDDVDKWMTSRQMRWSPKYISPLVLYPVERIISLGLDPGIKAQMLVQAISCTHAKMVCEQIAKIVPPGMTVDWVGTGPNGRTKDENDKVLFDFCPPKDAKTGKRKWTLDILVNVGMAGEGLDTTDVCEIVFLTSPNINNSVLQMIGRGARVIPGMKAQPKCTVNSDGASELAKHVGHAVMDLFDDGHNLGELNEDPGPEKPRELGDYDPLPDKLMVGILDVTLLDIRTDPMFQSVLDGTMKAAADIGSAEQIEKIVEDQIRAYIKKRDESFNASAIEAKTKEQIEAALSKVAWLVVRKAAEKSGMRPQSSFVGDVRKRINIKKKSTLGGVPNCTLPELEKHYEWLKQLEAQILSGQEPSWLR